MREFFKNWGALTVAIIALLASVCAIYFDNVHFERSLEIDNEHFESALEIDNEHFERVLELQQQQIEEQEERNKALDAQFGESMKTANEAKEADIEHYEDLNKQFKDAIEPHLRHQEILHYIQFVEERLERYWNWIDTTFSGYTEEVGKDYYYKARQNCESAKRELMAKNFDEAEQLVKAANANLDEGIRFVSSEEATEAVE